MPPERAKVVRTIIKRLKKLYPNATTALHWSNPLELLVATILSAQCTDERVNQVTKTLFQKYRTAEDYMNANLRKLQMEIKPTGYYRQKARTLKALGKVLVERYGGEVPSSMDELLKLPGVARKTANVLLGTAFGIPSGIVVDTHMQRVSRRLGLTDQKSPEKIELDLMRVVPRRHWIFFSHAMIWHGRLICQARKPKCDECALNDICEKRI
ncbi:MAG: endonuclease III [Armatimonadota bacterium]|nr:endonuclease III [Armatimonadota bacterium]MCX7777036.1 endonuclease III [Armatimonadota bacterium]MDW8024896.1 endonuclease III [Armatimonadota bacterium]